MSIVARQSSLLTDQRQGAAVASTSARNPAVYVPGERVLHPFAPQRIPAPAQQLLPEADQRLAIHLLREGILPLHALLQALARHSERPESRLADLLLDHGLVAEAPLFTALHHLTGIGAADLAMTPDPRLIDRLGPVFCLSERLLPLRNLGHATVIAAADPEAFNRHRARLEQAFGPILPSLAPAARIDATILAARGTTMARAAETRVALAQSCRSYRKPSPATLGLLAGALLASLTLLRPILAILTLWAVATLIVSTLMKAAALIASRHKPPPESARAATLARLPVVSIMVALYRESNIAARLVKRREKLNYPRDCLDIMLVVEQEDSLTRSTLARADLPPWMRVVVVPAGRVKTKPRALNFGLTQCKGSIVGVYDAEDAPEPDQIRKVVARFAQRGRQVACLQGALDFYNPTKNWLARCFTIEYAGWFRVMLPGLERLGVPLPLGGTTLFFRRDVLEALGGWDAHNVTEDADLGIRLARHGYRTEILPTTTLEEANCLGVPWVKQRSRWIKGYMMTYLTHMRAPLTLYRELGPRGFAGFQILFLGSLSQALLAPLLWSLWSFCLGLGHPLSGLIGPQTMILLTALFMACEIISMAIGVLGLQRSGHKMSVLWVPTLMLYFPLQACAAYKALWEMLRNPFYWDKTTHGTLH
jgi:cellulose synthase/poly-beta-1,6-N-acetylglucosamine synthase-like glycosyltransferase